jgi:two-component system sensor histidine kinase BaeS
MAEPKGALPTPNARRLTAVITLVALVPAGLFAVAVVSVFSEMSATASPASLRHALVGALGWGAAAVVPLAALAAYLIARRIAGPVARLTEAARAMALGEAGVRVERVPAAPEFAELSTVFDVMAGTLERQDQLRRRLVADVAHELRTPIAVLQAWVEAMIEGVAEMTTANMSSLLDETIRLSRIVRDLEVLASSDVAALTMQSQSVDLADVASDAADALEARVLSAGLTLVRKLEPVIVDGDGELLHQIISNLLTNAIKFTPAGGRVTLTVRPSGGAADVIVEDTGVGIPADELPHVFERFWRGHAAIGMTGSGIGLAVVASLVQAHGGSAEATSLGGKGARFVVTLPRS